MELLENPVTEFVKTESNSTLIVRTWRSAGAGAGY